MPRPCQTVLPSGEPCRREAALDSDYCEVCASVSGSPSSSRLYNLAVGQARAEEVARHSDATNLQNELALARMLFERRYNAIASEGDEELRTQSGPLLDMLRKIADLAVQGDALARKRGDLLDKTRVTSLAESLMMCVNDVIVDRIEDEKLAGELVTEIGTYFLEIIKKETLTC